MPHHSLIDRTEALRVYTADECGSDGYPLAWRTLPEEWLLDWSSGIGESEYPPGAQMGIKDVIRATAGHRCIRCLHPYRCGEQRWHGGRWSLCDRHCTHRGPFRHAMSDGAWQEHDADSGVTPYLFALNGIRVEAEWRILTVHHLDGDKRNCRWWNLAALCQRCHLTIQGKVRMDRRWLHEHSDWFRPYVAAYYAATYLGEEVTREQAVARLDELLALEHRQEALSL